MKFGIFKKEDRKKKDKNLLVAASVIAAMAYQAAISPPGGVASVNAGEAAVSSADHKKLGPGDSVLAYSYSDLSNRFWIANTISLMSSLSVIFLYVSGLSLKRKIQVWTIRVAMWITLTSMTVAYVSAVVAISPSNNWAKISNTLKALICAVYAWVILLCLSFLILVYRFCRYIVKKITRKLFKKKNTSAAPAPAPAPDADMV